MRSFFVRAVKEPLWQEERVGVANLKPMTRVIQLGNKLWRLVMEPEGSVRWATAGTGEAMLIAWAASERLELVREDGAGWR